MKTIPLTVLMFEGCQGRAYLARMRQSGMKPERLVLMVNPSHPATGKPVGRFWPESMRLQMAERVQERALNFWPRQIRSRERQLFSSVVSEMQKISAGADSLIDTMLGVFRYEEFAESVIRVAARNLEDPELTSAVAALGGATMLFTGGGILRKNLLSLPNTRFLHVHPGHLPEVRGGDGLLWSMLVRGRPGASCFYMAEGIDTGELIATRDFPALRFKVDGKRPDDQTLYRAIFSFCDPLLRAELLVGDVLSRGENPGTLSSRNQLETDGVTYHFVHPKLRKRALELLFPLPSD